VSALLLLTRAGAAEQSSARHTDVAPMHSALPAASAHELPWFSRLRDSHALLFFAVLLLVAWQRMAWQPSVVAPLLLLHLVLCLLQLVPKSCIRLICVHVFMFVSWSQQQRSKRPLCCDQLEQKGNRCPITFSWRQLVSIHTAVLSTNSDQIFPDSACCCQ
jgi:hypothetical protein